LQDRENAALGFAAPKTIRLALRVPGRPNVSITLLDVGPPGQQADAHILLPPNRSESIVEFELEGEVDEKVRVEISHPDGVEEEASKLVEGFFEVGRTRRRSKPERPEPASEPTEPLSAEPEPPPVPAEESAAQRWEDSVKDPAFLQVLKVIEERRSINELELHEVLGSPRRV